MKKLLLAALVALLMLAGCSSKDKTDATATPEASATPEATETAKPSETPKATASADATTYKDGVYEGEAEGYKGPIIVTVEIVAGKIESVDIYSQNETEEVAAGALESIPAAIVKNQTTDVDAVSGATFTSKGIIDAVNEALNAAKS